MVLMSKLSTLSVGDVTPASADELGRLTSLGLRLFTILIRLFWDLDQQLLSAENVFGVADRLQCAACIAIEAFGIERPKHKVPYLDVGELAIKVTYWPLILNSGTRLERAAALRKPPDVPKRVK